MKLFGKRGKKKGKAAKKSARKPDTKLRRLARRGVLGVVAAWLALSAVGGWYVSHPLAWLMDARDAWPAFVTVPLSWFGDRTILLTDGLGLTGHDALYDPDAPAPTFGVHYAGAPARHGAPAPADIVTVDRGSFALGYSPSLGHAVWAAYRIPAAAKFEPEQRPAFRKDPALPNCPKPADYARSGYDRGHLAPNHAIATRFGAEAQYKTFYMSNVAPQRPALNRGPWRFMERLAADLWTAAYGDIWVIVGTVSRTRANLPGTTVDVPDAYWQVLAAQTDEGLRVLALYMSQTIPFGAFPVHNIVTLEHLERLTGLTFFPNLPSFLKRPLAGDLPTRLWPVKWYHLFRLFWLRMGA